MITNYPSISMVEIKRRYQSGEFRHWFDPTTTTFSNTALPATGVKTSHGNYFISSGAKPSGVIAYSIQHQDLKTGDIEALDALHCHETFDVARDALRMHLKAMEKSLA